MPGTFELKTAKDGQTYFRLKSSNGEIILASEMYAAKTSAQNGIESVKTNASLDERYEKRTSDSSKQYFVLKAANHQVIGNSEMYEDESSRDAGIESVKKTAPDAEVDDQTEAAAAAV